MPAGSEYREVFYRTYVSDHQGEIVEDRSAPAFEADIVARLPRDTTAAVLDVGCGQGQVVRLLRAHGYSDVRGIDLSGEQVALAIKLGTERVEQADLFEFAASHEGQFDAVVAIDLVEHFDRADIPRLFTCLASLLRPDGTLVLRTPNACSPYFGRIRYGDLTHGLAYTARSLQQATAAAGFRSVHSYPVRPSGTGYRQRARRLIWFALEAVMILPLIVETGVLRGHIVTQNLVAVATK